METSALTIRLDFWIFSEGKELLSALVECQKEKSCYVLSSENFNSKVRDQEAGASVSRYRQSTFTLMRTLSGMNTYTYDLSFLHTKLFILKSRLVLQFSDSEKKELLRAVIWASLEESTRWGRICVSVKSRYVFWWVISTRERGITMAGFCRTPYEQGRR